jgi:hypothetical protein
MSTLEQASVPRFLPLMRLVRWLLLALALVNLGLTVVGATMYPAYANAYPEELAPTIAWTPETTLASLDKLGWSPAVFSLFYIVPSLLVLLANTAMALIMLWRKGDNLFGLFAGLVFVLGAHGGDMYNPLYDLFPGLEGFFGYLGGLSWQLMFIFLLVFPDGRFVPRWTRWTLLGWLAINLAAPLVEPTNPIFSAVSILLVLVCVGSLPYRYLRHADIIQRQQTKIVVYAVAFLSVVTFSIALPNVFIAPAAEGSGSALLRAAVIRSVTQLLAATIPLSMGVAVLRYRLWDIDVIIRKTLVYAVLTGLLAGVYFGTVIVLQTVFGSLTGGQSPVVIVISTLVIAALFGSLRGRVQTVIDRRFFRQKYDAEQVLERFAQTARDEVELEALKVEMMRIVEETMRPERVGLWLRRDGGDR